jgi:hypothetical protein
MTNITENNLILISEEDKLELFDEIICKIQSKKNENSTRDYLTDFIDFIELYNISNEEDDYIYDYHFHYTDIKNLTILEEFYEIVYYITNYDALDDSFDLSEDYCLNNYIYYDFNQCPKKIFSEIFINEFKMYLYTILNLVNTLK